MFDESVVFPWIQGPPEWKQRQLPHLVTFGGTDIGQHSSLRFTSGQERTEVCSVHIHYRSIPPGKYRVRVRIPANDQSQSPARVEPLGQELEVTVLPASRESLDTLSHYLQAKLRETPDAAIDIAQRYLTDVRHRELVPIGLQFLRLREADLSPKRREARERLARDLFKAAPDLGQAAFIDIATSRNEQANLALFRILRTESTRLTDDQLLQISQAPNIWVRILAYVSFPRQCKSDSVQALKQELRDFQTPLPGDELVRLLKNLDSGAFQIRRRAQARLNQTGERLELFARGALRESPSPEVRGVLQGYLSAIEKDDLRFLGRRTLDELVSLDTPEACEVLRILANGPPESRMAQLAASRFVSVKQRHR